MAAIDAGANFDPVDYYKLQLAGKIDQAARDFFDARKKESKVDEEAIEREFQKYLAKQKEHTDENKELKKLKGWRTFMWVLFFISLFCLIGGLVYVTDELQTYLGFGIGCLIVGPILFIISLLVIYKVLNPKIKEAENAAALREAALKKMLEALKAAIRPLSRLFRYDDFKNIVNSTTDMFSLDLEIPEERMDFLQNVYSYTDLLEESQSVLALMSGTIDSNPWIRIKINDHGMRPKTYTGYRTITWTEHYVDSQGRSRSRTRSETLTAYYTHDAPYWEEIPVTIYGNMAAPKLSFSRLPNSKLDTSDPKKVKDYVESETKKFTKKGEKAVHEGKTFQPLANNEFEALFRAYNRDNEVQFRLLFTPLAQQNMLEIIKKKDGVSYGDDFAFYKKGTINMVQSRHSISNFDYNYTFAYSFLSVKGMRAHFIKMISDLFKSLYFDLAPLFAIPLYQMTDAGKYDPKKIRRRGDISEYEAMRVANEMSDYEFREDSADTEQLLRCKYMGTKGKSDLFEVSSLAYESIDMTEYVPVFGGDGRTHNVPVHYVDYQPRRRNRSMWVRRFDEKKEKCDNGKLDEFLLGHGGSSIDGFVSYLDEEDPFSIGDEDTTIEEENRLFESFFTSIEDRLEELDKTDGASATKKKK